MKRHVPYLVVFSLLAGSVLTACFLLFFHGSKPPVPLEADTGISEKQEGEAHIVPIQEEWNTYHGTPALTGASLVAFPDKLKLQWRFMAEASVTGTPVYCGGRLFFANVKGVIFALNSAGELLWSSKVSTGLKADGTPRLASFDAPLVCFGDLLYACDADGLVVALDAASGEERWRQQIDCVILGSPNYGFLPAPDGGSETPLLYIIGQDEGALHGLDALTGEKRWVSEEVGRCDASPGVGDGVVAYGSCASAIHVFSGTTGELLHNVEIGGESQVASGVTILGGDGISGCRSGKVLRFNLHTGALVWSSEVTKAEIFTTPAVAGNWVVIGDENGDLFGLRADTGEKRWTTSLDDPLKSPVIVGDKVVVSAEGILHMVRLETGEALWSLEVSDGITSPCIAGNLVVVGSDDGTVAAFCGDAH